MPVVTRRRSTSSARWPPATPTTALVLVLVVTIALYVPLVGYRWDYLAHYLTGAGLALGTVIVGTRRGLPVPGAVGVACTLVLGLGLVGEIWWSGSLFRDWADIGMGAIGSTVVAAFVLRIELDAGATGRLAPLAAFLVIVGVVVRFGLDDAGSLL